MISVNPMSVATFILGSTATFIGYASDGVLATNFPKYFIRVNAVASVQMKYFVKFDARPLSLAYPINVAVDFTSCAPFQNYFK